MGPIVLTVAVPALTRAVSLGPGKVVVPQLEACDQSPEETPQE